MAGQTELNGTKIEMAQKYESYTMFHSLKRTMTSEQLSYDRTTVYSPDFAIFYVKFI